MIRGFAILLALAAAVPAAAQQQSDRWGTFELSVSGYKPNIDAEFGGAHTPYADVFGNSKAWMFRLDVAKTIFTGFGELDVGIGGGYSWKSGHGFTSDPNTGQPTTNRADDRTRFVVFPARVFLAYRLDIAAEEWHIPLVPYARASLDRYWWRTTNGTGGTSDSNGLAGSGATNGYSLSLGISLLLDFFDPTLARDMDRDTGVNHAYFFAEFTQSYVKDFGSSKSWDIGNDGIQISGGLMLAF